MSLHRNCPHCDKSYRLTEKHLNRKLTCKVCQEEMFFTDNKSTPSAKVSKKVKKVSPGSVTKNKNIKRSTPNSKSPQRKKPVKKSSSLVTTFPLLLLLAAGGAGTWGYLEYAKTKTTSTTSVTPIVATANIQNELPEEPIPTEPIAQVAEPVKEVLEKVEMQVEPEVFIETPKEMPEAKVVVKEEQPVPQEPIVYTPEVPIHKTIDQHCYQCHNKHKSKGNFNLDNMNFEELDLFTYGKLETMIESITYQEMPPEDEPQPSEEESKELITWLKKLESSNKSRISRMKPKTTMRRLNFMEFKNSIRDLFNIDPNLLTSLDDFPEDQYHGKYSNNGDALQMSSFLLGAYPKVAKEIVDTVYGVEKNKDLTPLIFNAPFVPKITIKNPIRKKYKITAEDVKLFGTAGWKKGEYQDFSNRSSFEIRQFSQSASLTSPNYSGGVPERGYYEITFTAMGKNRLPKGKVIKQKTYWNQEKPLSVQLYVGNKVVGEWDLLDDKLKEYKIQVYMDKRQGIAFRLPQGFASHWANYKNNPLKSVFGAPKPSKGKTVNINDWFNFYADNYPTLRLTNVKVEGPLVLEEDKLAHEALLGGKTFEKASSRTVTNDLMEKAFRGYANDKNKLYIASYAGTSRNFENTKHAIQGGVETILSSPWFLYMVEQADEKGFLTGLSLANRLSYFIWGSMPDEELLGLAKSGDLIKDSVLKAQVQRMIESEKSWGLVERLTDEWINLRILGEMPPSRSEYPEYFSLKVEKNSRLETMHFVEYLLKENLTVQNFIHSDFTFLNRDLAKFYGYPKPENFPNDLFVKTPILNKKRGGLMGHSSVLTASADGVMTNPVIRGLWVLRTLFGEDVPPPPESAEPIEVDLREAKTFRSQLELHSSVKNCKSCHQKFDHFGYALQSFDVVGQERNFFTIKGKKRRGNKVPIETHATFPNGKKVDDIVDMKSVLMKSSGDFTTGLTKQLLEIACGREMTVLDKAAISSITSRARGYKYRLADLVTLVATSPTFRSK